MAGRPPKKPATPFGRRLASIRNERGLSQAQFAEKLGITPSLLGYYERNGNPSVEVVSELASKLGISAAELLDELVDDRPKKRGPKSKLDEAFEKARQLTRREQELVVRFIETLVGANVDDDTADKEPESAKGKPSRTASLKPKTSTTRKARAAG